MHLRHPVSCTYIITWLYLNHRYMRYICAKYIIYTFISDAYIQPIALHIYTAYCMWRVISSFSNLNRESSSFGFFCHVPLKTDQRDCKWRLRLNDTPLVIGRICARYIQYICARYIQYICAKDIYVRLNDTPHVTGCICARSISCTYISHVIQV